MDFNSHEATELFLYATTDSRHYSAWLLPAYQNLERKWRKGRFNYDLGLRLLTRYTLPAIAKQYRLEHGGMTDRWNTLFPAACREEVAATILAHFVAELRCGNSYLPTRAAR
jgi:hypothetical protein